MMRSLFLHGGWRCGSTYLWNKFREMPGVTAYYEPFSEELATHTDERIKRGLHKSWNSRHPDLARPYFSEYFPLLLPNGIGAQLYEDRFALQRYFVDHERPLEERAYLQMLVEHANVRTTRAVFGFSRSLGRVGAIKRRFDGQHCVLIRDPLQQWMSFRSYRTDDGIPSYFELCTLLILSLAPQGSPAARLAGWLGVPRTQETSFREQYRFMLKQFQSLPDELSYQVFLVTYLLSYIEAIENADLVIDLELLGASWLYRHMIELAINEGSGIVVDFSDCQMPVRNTTNLSIDHARLASCVVIEVLAALDDPSKAIASPDRWKTWDIIFRKLRSSCDSPES